MPRRSLAMRVWIAVVALLVVMPGLVWAQGTVPVSEEEVRRGDPSVPNVALVVNIGAGFEPAVGMLDTLAEKD
jgi:hypothetical protein